MSMKNLLAFKYLSICLNTVFFSTISMFFSSLKSVILLDGFD